MIINDIKDQLRQEIVKDIKAESYQFLEKIVKETKQDEPETFSRMT